MNEVSEVSEVPKVSEVSEASKVSEVTEEGKDSKEMNHSDNKPGEKRGRGYTFCGSSFYISPEVLDGKLASPASDLWAFGCILYQLYTGKVLFYEDNE